MLTRKWLLPAVAGVVLLGHIGASAAAEITVSAAASLTNAFTEVGKAYERANAGSKVLFNYGSSGALLQQISRGAPVDVFASADLESMDRAQKQNLIVTQTRADFVANALVLVVPVGRGIALTSVSGLTDAAVQRIGIGIPGSVPAGRYAKEALEIAGLWEVLKDKYVFGQNVRQVLDYVARGEVDAGIVYATDAASMQGKVTVVAELQTKNAILYPIAVVRGGGSERAARRFVDFVRAPPAQAILAKYGFRTP